MPVGTENSCNQLENLSSGLTVGDTAKDNSEGGKKQNGGNVIVKGEIDPSRSILA